MDPWKGSLSQKMQVEVLPTKTQGKPTGVTHTWLSRKKD
jgi:hypothetical protein